MERKEAKLQGMVTLNSCKVNYLIVITVQSITVTRSTSSKKTGVESHDHDMVGNGESGMKGGQVTRNGNFEFMHS